MFVCLAVRSEAHCGLGLIPSPFVSSGGLTVVCLLPTWELVGSWLLSVVRPHWPESSQAPWRLPASFCELMGKEDQRPGMTGTQPLLMHRQGRENNLIWPLASLRSGEVVRSNCCGVYHAGCCGCVELSDCVHPPSQCWCSGTPVTQLHQQTSIFGWHKVTLVFHSRPQWCCRWAVMHCGNTTAALFWDPSPRCLLV